jgi:hypothetical protein
MMKTTPLALCAAIGAFLAVTLPTTANAQDKSRSQGFYLGVALEGIGVVFEDADTTDSGSGLSVTVGYGFNPKLSLYGQFSGASVEDGDRDDYGVGHFDIGTRVHFRAPAKTVVPFIQAGISSRAIKQDFGRDEVEGNGFGLAVGGGINAHFNPALAFNAGVVWSVGNVGDFKLNGSSAGLDSAGMTTARVQIGIVWFPQQK